MVCATKKNEVVWEFMPWRDDERLYRKLTSLRRNIPVGAARYDPRSKKIFGPKEMYPSWDNWVLARAQQVWDTELTRAERKAWIDACNKYHSTANKLFGWWIGSNGQLVDITDFNAKVRGVFTEACLTVFKSYMPENLPKPMARLITELASDYFWRIADAES
jgi:hypothetical protein